MSSLERRISQLEELLQPVPEPQPVSEEHTRVREHLEDAIARWHQLRDEHPDVGRLALYPPAREQLRDLSNLMMLERHFSRGAPVDPYAVARLRERGFPVDELL